VRAASRRCVPLPLIAMPGVALTTSVVEQPQARHTAAAATPADASRQQSASGLTAEPAVSGLPRKARNAGAMAARRGQVLEKTRLCKYHMSTGCDRGSSCSFAHGEAALRPQPDLARTQLCNRFLRSGTCPKGDACNFAHGEEQLRRIAPRTRTAAPPATSATRRAGRSRTHPGPRVPESEPGVENLRQQVEQLRTELTALAGGAAIRGATTLLPCIQPQSPWDLATATPGASSDDGTSEWHSESGMFSSPVRQMAGAVDDEGDIMDHHDAPEERPKEEEPEEVFDVELVVKSTFFSLEPTDRNHLSAVRVCPRSRSAPAPLQRPARETDAKPMCEGF